MTDAFSSHRIETAHGVVHVVTRRQIEASDRWRHVFARAFADLRKDSRYYHIIEETISQGFEYQYFVLEDKAGEARAIQPFFLLDQDLVAGAGLIVQKAVWPLRKL